MSRSVLLAAIPAGIGLTVAHGAGSDIAATEEALDSAAHLTQRILAFRVASRFHPARCVYHSWWTA